MRCNGRKAYLRQAKLFSVDVVPKRTLPEFPYRNPRRCHMVAAEAAMIAIAGAELLKVLDEGRPRYGARWLTLDTDYFVDHAFKHIIAIRAGQSREDHIA